MDNLPRTNEEDSVRSFGGDRAAVEANHREFPHLIMQLVGKPCELAHIERAKIEKEVPVHKFVVHVKEVNLLLFACPIGILRFPWCACQDIVGRRRCFQGRVI